MKIKNLFKKINKEIFLTYPFSIIMSYLLTTLTIIKIDRGSKEYITNLLFALLVTIPFSVKLEGLIRNRWNKYKKIAYALIFINLASIFFYLQRINRNEKELFIFSIFILYSIFLFLVSDDFNDFVGHFVHTVQVAISSMFFSLVMALGLIFINFTIEKLFNVEIGHKMETKIITAVYGYFFSLAFLSSVEKKKEEIYSKFLEFLMSKVFTPLLFAYLIILYTYLGKVLITKVYPKNIVPYLIIFYGLTGAFFSYSAKFITKKIVQLFIKIFYKTLIPLIILAFYSIIQRIMQYNLTENRYFIVMAILWFSILVMADLFFKKIFEKIFIVSLIILSLIAVLGPLSSINMSKFFQKNKFNKLISIDKNNISEDEIERIYGIIEYFEKKHSVKDLGLEENINNFELMKKLGYTYIPYSESQKDGEWINLDGKGKIYKIDSYDLLVPNMKGQFTYENFSIDFSDSKFIKIKENDYIVNISYNEMVMTIFSNLSEEEKGTYKLVEELVYKTKIPEINKELTFLISDLNCLYNKNTDIINNLHIDGIVIVKNTKSKIAEK